MKTNKTSIINESHKSLNIHPEIFPLLKSTNESINFNFRDPANFSEANLNSLSLTDGKYECFKSSEDSLGNQILKANKYSRNHSNLSKISSSNIETKPIFNTYNNCQRNVNDISISTFDNVSSILSQSKISVKYKPIRLNKLKSNLPNVKVYENRRLFDKRNMNKIKN